MGGFSQTTLMPRQSRQSRHQQKPAVLTIFAGKKSARKKKAAPSFPSPSPSSCSSPSSSQQQTQSATDKARMKKQNQSMKTGGRGDVSEGSRYQTETRKIILSLNKVKKTTPQGKELIKNINLGMYLGAKIGILGANGAGKSTLMRILAGVDKQFDGEIYLDDGIKIGYLPQEPELDAGETVGENVIAKAAGQKNEKRKRVHGTRIEQVNQLSGNREDHHIVEHHDECDAKVCRQGKLFGELRGCR